MKENTISFQIVNNPYHVLGVYAGASVAEENRNRNRICAHLDVGNLPTFEEFDEIPYYKVNRTKESVLEASQILSLSRDRISNALLWRGENNKTWSVELNAASTALAQGDIFDAILHYEQLVYDNQIRESFIRDVTHGLLELSCDNLAELVIHQIKSYPFLIEKFLSGKSIIYNCRLTKKLFDEICLDRIVSVTDDMAENTPATYGIFFDYGQFLTWLKSQCDLILYQLKIFKQIYGANSLAYKYYIERYSAFLFSNALKIVEGVTKQVPIHIFSYSYSSSRSVVIEWVMILSNTIAYVNDAVRIGDIQLSQDSQQVIENVDNLYYKKLQKSSEVIYESFFRKEAKLISKTRINFLNPHAFFDEFKKNSSNFKMLFNAILSICGDYPKYHEFIQMCLSDFVNFEKETLREAKNHIYMVDEDKLPYLNKEQISEINEYNNQLKYMLTEVKKETTEICSHDNIPDNIIKNINPEICELFEHASINFPNYSETEPNLKVSHESRIHLSIFKRLIKKIFDYR